MAADRYPKRPRVFGLKFTRLLAKTGVANSIGVDGCWLLTVIVSMEDAAGYTRPVTFHSGQLISQAGLKNEDKLMRVRKRLVDGGWLHYTPGRRGVAAQYWVLVPPDYRTKDDDSSDEAPGKYEAGESAQVARFNQEQPEQPESQYARPCGESVGTDGKTGIAVSPESADDPRSERGSFFPVPDPDSSQQSVRPTPVGFDPLKAEQEARHLFLSRWNTSGLRPISSLNVTLQGHLSAALLDPDWLRDYPAAIEQAGQNPFFATGQGRKRGPLDVSEILYDHDMPRKILAGVYDQRATAGTTARTTPQPSGLGKIKALRQQREAEDAARGKSHG